MTATAEWNATTERNRCRRYGPQIAGVLAAAFGLSAAYTGYTTVTGLTPDGFNATHPAMWAFYLLGFATVALAALNRDWALWIVLTAVAGFLAIGILVYPATFAPHLQTTLGWFENDVYMGLLVLAEYLCVLRLRRVRLEAS